MSTEIISIEVSVGGRKYTLRVNASEEKFAREAAELLDQGIAGLKGKYKATDNQDYLAMSAIMNLGEALQQLSELNGDVEYASGRLDQLINALEAK